MSQIAIVSTVMSSNRQMLEFSNFHLRQGVDQLIIFNDAPESHPLPALVDLVGVKVIDCDPNYWAEHNLSKPQSIEERQKFNAKFGASLAKNEGCDWLIHIDCDELVFCKQGDLRRVLGQSSTDGVRFSLREAISSRLIYDSIFSPRLFKVKPNKLQLKAAKILGCSNALFEGEYFRGHTKSKLAVRIQDEVTEYGIHSITMCNRTPVIGDIATIKLLHFDCVGIDDWKSKWDKRLDGTGYAADMRQNRSTQLELYREAKETGEEALQKLFFRLHSLSKRECVMLYLLGMLEYISGARRETL